MPELPEVETVRRGLAAKLTGRRFVEVDQRRPNLRYPLPERLVDRVVGRTVETIDRRAKYLLLKLDDGMVLVIHLGMSGRMMLAEERSEPGPHDHLIFETDDGTVVTFNDVRRFGMVDLVSSNALEAYPALASLGPEPLGDAFTPQTLSDRLAGKRTPVKAALLDQRNVAGLGNIYVCEALFDAGISPRRLAKTVVGKRAERLVPAIKDVLTRAIDAGGSSLRDYVQASGELGYFQHEWAVYGREGEPCRGCDCDWRTNGGVARLVQSNRSTFYCPRRQS
ncbi:MAG: bifunctional DNA-formamidopyrimidine glycosylase/DNA-(apurinic or apyrimidinic site) lyase [Pseudomonadota bacterium]